MCELRSFTVQLSSFHSFAGMMIHYMTRVNSQEDQTFLPSLWKHRVGGMEVGRDAVLGSESDSTDLSEPSALTISLSQLANTLTMRCVHLLSSQKNASLWVRVQRNTC